MIYQVEENLMNGILQIVGAAPTSQGSDVFQALKQTIVQQNQEFTQKEHEDKIAAAIEKHIADRNPNKDAGQASPGEAASMTIDTGTTAA